MRSTGKIIEISKDFESNRIRLTVELNDNIGREELSQIRAQDLLDIAIEKHSEKKSNSANGLFWSCINKLSLYNNIKKWDMYLRILKDYGIFTYVCILPSSYEALKKIYREVEEVGEYTREDGLNFLELHCYQGISEYNSRDFSRLIDCVICEMKDCGIETPDEEELRLAIEAREKRNNG